MCIRDRVTTKGTNVGYIQRGGSPSHFDRNLASFMGYKAVEAIVNDNTGNVVVQRKGEYIMVPLEEALETPKAFCKDMYKMCIRDRYQPKQLVILDIYENTLYYLELELRRYIHELEIESGYGIRLDLEITSIRDKASVNSLFERYRPQVVFHAAAHKHVPLMEKTPKEAVKNNIFGTRNVLDACVEYQVEKFVQISTDKAVKPTNVMGTCLLYTSYVPWALPSNPQPFLRQENQALNWQKMKWKSVLVSMANRELTAKL